MASASASLGVAPEASVYMYRIFGCRGDTTLNLILQAFEAAFEDGVDVIMSPSLGATQPFESAVDLLRQDQVQRRRDPGGGGQLRKLRSLLSQLSGRRPLCLRRRICRWHELPSRSITPSAQMEASSTTPMSHPMMTLPVRTTYFSPMTGRKLGATRTLGRRPPPRPDLSKVIVVYSYNSFCSFEFDVRMSPDGFSHAWFVVPDDVDYNLRPPASSGTTRLIYAGASMIRYLQAFNSLARITPSPSMTRLSSTPRSPTATA